MREQREQVAVRLAGGHVELPDGVLEREPDAREHEAVRQVPRRVLHGDVVEVELDLDHLLAPFPGEGAGVVPPGDPRGESIS